VKSTSIESADIEAFEEQISENSSLVDQTKLAERSTDIVLHRSLLNDLPIILSLIATFCILLWFTFVYREWLITLVSFEPFLLLALVIVFASVLVGALVAYRRYDVKYLISGDGIEARRGFLSNDQIEAKLEYYQIRGTEIHRTLFQRFIGTGDLLVSGSGTDDREVSFHGISRPSYYQLFIQSRHRLEAQGSKAAWINNQDSLLPNQDGR
jgi:hypothetical protein